ncbi:hypothetical protein H7F51_17035 [Novosphingobium flavum]|uniref:SIR2-like domain-containing protein n=1 Tax=Novosphingobium flavum TaxID=1778672 RepID=A0A7X1KN32_9SPHN|nr:hypothetical protein [Novosphingobium flavum]MBC2667227.1 hypothetical protein [Novosphingobium flavum]
MIRTKTAFILGPGAAAELHMPSPLDVLERIAQALDFSRASANQLTRDAAAILRHVAKLAERTKSSEEALFKAAQRINQSAKVARTIEGVIEQNNDNPLVAAFGKLALAVFTLQSEQRSSVRATPQGHNALPLQTGDYWLLELGKLITAGLPRNKLEQGLGDVVIVNFGYDRATEHFLPFVLTTAYGMTLSEAQRIVAARLKFYHPYGSVGRLPWQLGDLPDVEFANEMPWNMAALSTALKTGDQALADRASLAELRGAVAKSQRIVFLGCDFSPQSLDLIIDGSLSHNPELIVTMNGLSGPNRAAAVRMLKRKSGNERDDRLILAEGRCLDVLKDYALMLES